MLSSNLTTEPSSMITTADEDSDYAWRMRIYPNGIHDHPNLVSLYLEAIQTPFEKNNCCIERNNIEFKFLVYRIKNPSNDSSSPSSSFSSTATTTSIDSSKDSLSLVYETNTQKFDFDLQGARVINGFPSIGTFQREEINLLVKLHIYTYTKSQFQDYYKGFNNEQSLTTFERFYNHDAYFDVEFTFEEENYNNANTKNSIKAHLYYLYSLKLKDNLSFDLLKDIYINSGIMGLENLCKLAADQLVNLINYDNWDQVLKVAWDSDILSSKLQLKKSALDFVHGNWSIIRNTENMKQLLASATIECIEELMETKIFGTPK
nr:4218_t:CDS:2 [Entrophospora candida]